MSLLDMYRYTWPPEDWPESKRWAYQAGSGVHVRTMPESLNELRIDSRWPAFFPAPMCLVTATDGKWTALEKVVGASIVNRFPYVVALSFCREALSARHHPRSHFMATLERGGQAVIQFLPPGPALDGVMRTIATTAEAATAERLSATGLSARPARSNDCPVLEDAYMAYETRLVRPARDFGGQSIYDRPWLDVGSHRVYFLEIQAIQLRGDIARGEVQIRWRSLPLWQPRWATPISMANEPAVLKQLLYQKGFTADYAFPASNTVAFEADELVNGRAVKHLPSLAQDQVEIDNDRARWPCFFPSSVGMITSRAENGATNLMPCGSTTILSRNPLVIAPSVSYAAINQRYAPRATLDIIRQTRRFGCGVPFRSDQVLAAIRYAGNVSLAHDPNKIANAGLTIADDAHTPRVRELPVHYDCELMHEIRLGTHFLLPGKVVSITVRDDVSLANPLVWVPWADVAAVSAQEQCA